MDVLYLLAGIFFFLTFLYFYFLHNHHYWQDRNIPCAKNIWPIIGNAPVFAFFRNVGNSVTKIYKNHPKDSMVGFYNYNKPCLLVCDPELVKSVLITNFASFAANDVVLDENAEPLLVKNPFFTIGEPWKTGRSRLSTALTGNKLKNYSQTLKETMNKMEKYLNEKSKFGIYEVDGKELLSKVSGEVAANVGFGTEGNCFNEAKENESFTTWGKLFFSTSWESKLKMLIMLQFPWVLAILQLSFVPKNFEHFWIHLMKKSSENKKNQTLYFVDTVIEEEKKEGNPKTFNRDIASHMLSFFFGLFETSAVAMTFVCYSLAVNKKVQTKVREEVLNAIKKHGDLNYEAVGDLVYLDQVILESLRLFPVINTQIRKCTREIELVGPDGLRYLVRPGESVYIPIEGLHKNPKFWQDPEDFKPERFNREKSGQIGTVHLPFGEGPRMCPGQKLGQLMAKMTFATLLMKFEINLSEKTRIPIELDKFMALSYTKGGMWIKLKKLR